MLNTETAYKVIDHALDLGADFSDLFIEKNQNRHIRVLDQKVHEIQSGIDFGVGIRLVYGTKVLYGYSNSTDEDELLRIVHTLAVIDRKNRIKKIEEIPFQPVFNDHPCTSGLAQNRDMEAKIQWLMTVDQAARKSSSQIKQVNLSALQRFQEIEIFNSDRLHRQDSRNYTRVSCSAIAEEGAEKSQGSLAPGALMGWEFTEQLDAKGIGNEIARIARIKLNAAPCPAGKMPVIIDKGFGGVIFHEACGHLLETTSVQKKASVFHDKMGEKIASEVVTAIDDGTLPNVWGSTNIDDEGMLTCKTTLIENGVLKSFLVDYVGSLKTGFERTGSGRRQSYKNPPASRMRNTYIAAGDSSLDEMISSIEKGIYCAKMGGGSVMPGTGEFNFNVDEAYLIENGKITKPLKSATLIGTGPDILNKISMVGDDLEVSAGMCGSVSGSVPVTVGQPAIKVDEILVGGKI